MPDSKPAPSTVELVTYNLSSLKARDVSILMNASQTGDVEAMAAMLARVVTDCPPEWGKPDDPNTYLELDFYGAFMDLIDGIGVTAKKLRSR